MKRFFVLTLNTKTYINEWVNIIANTAQQAAEHLTDGDHRVIKVRVIKVYEANFTPEKIQ